MLADKDLFNFNKAIELYEKGIKVQSLTPDNNQKNHIEHKYKELTVHHMKFEDFKTEENQFSQIFLDNRGFSHVPSHHRA